MVDTQIIFKLTAERHRIEGYIESLQKKIVDAQRDLIHVNATIRLFQIQDDPKQFPAHMGLFRLFRRGELFTYCQEALQSAPDGLDTRELAVYCIRKKGMDAGATRVIRSSWLSRRKCPGALFTKQKSRKRHIGDSSLIGKRF